MVSPAVGTALVAGVLAGYGVAIPVGAIGALLVGLTARTSARTGVAAALGVATVDGAYALVAVVCGGVLGGVIQPIAGPMRVVAAVVLVAIAVRTVVVAVRGHRHAAAERPVTPGRAYLALVGLTALNPATVLYFGALVLGHRSAYGPLAGTAFVLGAFAASASWQLLLAVGGTLLGRVVDTPRGRLGTALVSGAVTALLAVRLLLA